MRQPLQTRRVKEALVRIRTLFLDPGAKLTTADAAQMAGLDRQVCRVLLQNLVEAGFLERRLRGVFVCRPSPSHQPPTRSEGRSITIMSASLHPMEINRRRHRKEKRDKLRARLAAAPAVGRAAIAAKLENTCTPGSGPQPSPRTEILES